MENALLIRASKEDLLEDSLIIDFLLADYQKKLHRTSFELLLQKVYLESATFKRSIRDINDELSLISCIEKKRHIFNSLREIVGIVGSIVTSSHWQSPEIGSFNGNIKASINDYTRDQHLLGNAFEQIYKKQLIPLRSTIPVFSYLTSSGMAAMTTALLYILGETKKDGVILLGTSCYFETKQLVYKMFGERVKEVNASNLHEVVRCIKTCSPSTFIVDSLGNEPRTTLVDIESLVRLVSKESKNHLHLVVDTSARATNELLFRSFVMPSKVSIIGVTSLNKLFQFGMDRVTAGMVWGTGFKSMKLYDYRDHAGTNCPDSVVASLPTPNRKIINMYLKRIVRNNEVIGKYLDIDSKKGPYVIYSFGKTKWQLKRLSARIVQNAKKYQIPMVEGTSFGLQTTRVYVVALHTQYEKPFLRISSGTETLWEIERMKKALTLLVS